MKFENPKSLTRRWEISFAWVGVPGGHVGIYKRGTCGGLPKNHRNAQAINFHMRQMAVISGVF